MTVGSINVHNSLSLLQPIVKQRFKISANVCLTPFYCYDSIYCILRSVSLSYTQLEMNITSSSELLIQF